MFSVIRSTIKKNLRRRGLRIEKAGCLPKDFFAVVAAAALARTRGDEHLPVVLQVGANDGVTNDPIFPFLRSYSSRAFLIEPQPDVFERLRMNYSGITNATPIQVALEHTDGQVRMYRLAPGKEPKYRELHPHASNPSGFTSFDRDHVRGALLAKFPRYFEDADVDEWIDEFFVEGVTFATLRQRCDIDRIDLLQIDTEGYDYEILRMVFESPERILPRMVNYEVRHLSEYDRRAAVCLLRENGYSYFHHGHDLCAFRDLELG